MAANAQASASGIGFFGLLAVLFIALKLLGKVAWSWWWVLSPLWIPFWLVILGLIVALVWVIARG